MRGFFLFLALFLGWAHVALAQSGHGSEHETRIALVIGNGAYRSLSPLNNPARDAEAVGASLSALDFTVYLATDLDRLSLTRTVKFFADRAREADVALIYYAGHGAQINGTNYLLPTDFGQDLIFDTANALNLDGLLAALGSQLSTTIVIVDACLERPANLDPATSGLSWDAGGLQTMQPRIGTLVSYATTPGKVAYDGTALHSPFTGALLDHLATPLLDIELMLRRVRRDVVVNSNGLQRPTTLSSLLSEFYLIPQKMLENRHLLAAPRARNLDLAEAMSEQGFERKPILSDIANGMTLPQDTGTVNDVAQRVRDRQAIRAAQKQSEADALRALICRQLPTPLPASCQSLAGRGLLPN